MELAAIASREIANPLQSLPKTRLSKPCISSPSATFARLPVNYMDCPTPIFIAPMGKSEPCIIVIKWRGSRWYSLEIWRRLWLALLRNGGLFARHTQERRRRTNRASRRRRSSRIWHERIFSDRKNNIELFCYIVLDEGSVIDSMHFQ